MSSFAKDLLGWYDVARRNLPWRTPIGAPPPDAYHVLVSELMLQQTQVTTVIPYFRRFLERFPTIQSLASSDEQDVLRLWQGLGYYSRARNLRKAAQAVVADFAGVMPQTADELLSLPGVGRYTAGAIASIAFEQAAPILDGNVMRVICRIDAIRADPRQPEIQRRLWIRAAELLPKRRIGDFNSAMMELGATVCTPRSPACLVCPVRRHCAASAAGIVEKIPPPKKAKATPVERRVVLCIRRGDRWLIEQRPARGRWAGLWQFVTRELPTDDARVAPPVRTSRFRKIGEVRHQLTHRSYVFDVRRADATGDDQPAIAGPHAWSHLDQLDAYPISKPQLMIAAMLAS